MSRASGRGELRLPGPNAIGFTSMRSIRVSAVYRTRPIQLTGGLIALIDDRAQRRSRSPR